MTKKLLFPKLRRPGISFEAWVRECERTLKQTQELIELDMDIPEWCRMQNERNAKYLKELDKALSLSEQPPSSPTSETPSKDKPSD